MARTLPDGWEALEAAGAAPYEIATLRRLAADLPDDHAVFHGVHWTRLDHGYSVFGEVDFIVVGPQGQAVLIEQKNGALDETADGLVKHYTGKTKGVARQIHRSLATLQSRFQQGHAGQHLALDYLLYCPDYRVRSPATAGIPPERIVDAGQADRLAAIVATMLAAQPAAAGRIRSGRCQTRRATFQCRKLEHRGEPRFSAMTKLVDLDRRYRRS